jgi:hypothetical protein
MKRSRKSNKLSRRDFFSGTLGTGAALSLSSLLPTRAAGESAPGALIEGAIVIHVPSPAWRARGVERAFSARRAASSGKAGCPLTRRKSRYGTVSPCLEMA